MLICSLAIHKSLWKVNHDKVQLATQSGIKFIPEIPKLWITLDIPIGYSNVIQISSKFPMSSRFETALRRPQEPEITWTPCHDFAWFRQGTKRHLPQRQRDPKGSADHGFHMVSQFHHISTPSTPSTPKIEKFQIAEELYPHCSSWRLRMLSNLRWKWCGVVCIHSDRTDLFTSLAFAQVFNEPTACCDTDYGDRFSTVCCHMLPWGGLWAHRC